MRKIIHLAVLLAFSFMAISLTSCTPSETDSTESEDLGPDKLLKAVYAHEDGTKQLEYAFKYDTDHRIIEIVAGTMGSTKIVYTENGFVTSIPDDLPSVNTLNEEGLIVTTSTKDGAEEYRANYYYDGGALKSVTLEYYLMGNLIESETENVTLQWNEGNMVSYDLEGELIEYEYGNDKNDVPNIDINGLLFYDFVSPDVIPYIGKRSVNYVIRDGEYEYRYEFDQYGYPTKLFEDDILYYSFEYVKK